MSDLLNAALHYAGQGIAVFPLHSVTDERCSCGAYPCGPGNRGAGKHPRTTHGFHEASVDRGQLERWWKTWPEANIGCPAFDAVDVDEYKDGATESFARLSPLIPKTTPQTRTGGGGRQFLFKPGTLARGNLGIGIDSRYAGANYIILPPSRHRSGDAYSWTLTLTKGRLAPAPEFPLSENAGGEDDNLKERVSDGEIIETGRNKAAFRFACAVARWSDDKQLILQQTQAWVNRYCRNPEEVDVDKQVRGALKLGKTESLAQVAEGTTDKPRRRAVLLRSAAIRRERLRYLERGRVPLGLVTVLGGYGGLGKSQFTCLMAGKQSRGEYGVPGAVVIATAEDGLSTTVRPRLEAVQADLDLVHFIVIQSEDGLADGIAIPDDLDIVAAELQRASARLLIIDPLVAHLPTDIDSHKDQSVRRALAPLYRLAQELDCAIVVCIHLNKAQGLQPLQRLSGSGAFGNAARSVLLLDRDPDDPDGAEGQRRVLAHVKSNDGPLMPSLLFEIEPILLPATDVDPQVETSKMVLLGESPHNGQALLAAGAESEDERSALDEAVEFLRAELGDGQRHPAETLYKTAGKLGINPRTLRRARNSIGAESEKAGFGRGWEWWLEAREIGETACLPKGTSESRKPAFLREVDSPRDVSTSQALSTSEELSGSPADDEDELAARLREVGL